MLCVWIAAKNSLTTGSRCGSSHRVRSTRPPARPWERKPTAKPQREYGTSLSRSVHNPHNERMMLMKIVTGGIVYRQGQNSKLRAEVDKMEFPGVPATAPTPPAGSQGTLWLKNPPPQIGHYDRN